MRHGKGNKKLGKPTDQRLALLKSLVSSLITHSKITTTTVRAKEARRMAEKLVTLGKRGDLHARRLALQQIRHHELVKELFTNIAPRFLKRNGGYTRITKIGTRQGDSASMCVLEFVD